MVKKVVLSSAGLFQKVPDIGPQLLMYGITVSYPEGMEVFPCSSVHISNSFLPSKELYMYMVT